MLRRSKTTRGVIGRSARPSHVYDGDGQLQSILDMAVEGIVVIDDRGIITKFNRAAAKMFGYDEGEMLRQRVNLLMPQPTCDKHDRYITKYLKTGRGKIIGMGREVVGRRKDGTTFPVELAVSEIYHDGKRSFTGIVRDISNRKRLEKAILDASEREQRRIGTALHDGVCQELAGIAYLVKTLDHKLKAGQQVSAEEMGDVTNLLQQAVKHGRALARGLQPVDNLPGGLMGALRHLAADQNDLSNVSCQLRCPRPVEIHDSATATHLYRIAQECVRNAIQFAHAGQITISLLHKADGIELSVSDNAARPADAVFGEQMVYEMIQHRVQLIGGTISIGRRKGGCIRITCHIQQITGA